MRCDQAIFTSVRTATGQGYRVIAASAALTPEERNEVSARSPSHGGLCSNAEDARASAFYPLKSGRLCAALSCAAGREQTGRGGLRIYTRLAVFAADQFASFGHNPFNVLRSMEAEGLDVPELSPGQVLPPLDLPASIAAARDSWREPDIIAADWLAFVLRSAMCERPLVLACDLGLESSIEIVIGAVPPAMRSRISLSRGLKFSIGRPFTLSEISGETVSTERVIRGHPIVMIRPRAQAVPPATDLGEWEKLACTLWRREQYEALHELALSIEEGCGRAVLDRIAELRSEAITLDGGSVAELLRAAERGLAIGEATALEARLQGELLSGIRTRLEALWAGAGEAELSSAWQQVRALMLKSSAPDFSTGLAGTILRCLSAINPPLALQYSLSICDDPSLRLISHELRYVLSGLEDWAGTAAPADLPGAIEKLKRWQRAFPHFEHTAVVLDRLTQRARGL